MHVFRKKFIQKNYFNLNSKKFIIKKASICLKLIIINIKIFKFSFMAQKQTIIDEHCCIPLYKLFQISIHKF